MLPVLAAAQTPCRAMRSSWQAAWPHVRPWCHVRWRPAHGRVSWRQAWWQTYSGTSTGGHKGGEVKLENATLV